MSKRVVITGTGIISSIGLNTDEFWLNCLQAKSKIENIPDHWINYSDFVSGGDDLYDQNPHMDEKLGVQKSF